MKRLLLVVVLGALVVGATGCDVSPPAATVGGATISQSTLNGELATQITNTNARCATQIQAGLTSSPVGVGTEGDGTTPNAVTPAFADNILETLVLQKIEEQTLARHGVTVTAAEVAAATADYEGQLQQQLTTEQNNSSTPSGCTLSTSSPFSKQLPATYLKHQGASLADQEMFEVVVGHVDVSEAALRSYYAAHLAQVTQVCLDVLVSDTQAAAQALHDKIAAGTSFAAAATSTGVDTQESPPNGFLPCEYPSQAGVQFGATEGPVVEALKDGQLAGPLVLQGQNSAGAAVTYYVVVQMRQHQLVPFATLQSSIRQAILVAHSSVVGATLNRMVKTADVSVDPRYGTWSAAHGVTVPPPPTPAFVLNAKANVPPKPLLSIGGFTINPASG